MRLRFALLALLSLAACANEPRPTTTEPATPADPRFVTVRDGRFERGGRPYYFIGANLWYGQQLGARGNEEGRARLVRELDALAALGITNLRIMAASEGPAGEPWRVHPAVQNAPGVFDEDLMIGLDFVVAEMAKREMTAVLVLNNFFQWSGGMAQYVAWATGDPIPYPNDGKYTWDEFQEFSARFYAEPEARRLFLDYVRAVVGRTNSISGTPYVDDPAIMAWQLANEPRGFSKSAEMLEWVDEAAGFIQSLDPNHLVSLGAEGKLVPHNNMRFEEVSASPHLDYLTLHLWIENWGWFRPAEPEATFDVALGRAIAYVADHVAIAERLGKPIVLEEFGMSRDGGAFEPEAPTAWRDRYFRILFEASARLAEEGTALAGLNVWSFSGEGHGVRPGGDWAVGEPLTGDPPHERQGWYAIFSADSSTLDLIGTYARRVNAANSRGMTE